MTNDVKVELDSTEKDLDVDSEDDNSDSQNQAQVYQVLTGKEETVWQALAISQEQLGRLQQQNILSF